MGPLFTRILIAVLAVILIFALIPPFLRIIGFPVSADLMTIIKICVAAVALYYVLRGAPKFSLPQ